MTKDIKIIYIWCLEFDCTSGPWTTFIGSITFEGSTIKQICEDKGIRRIKNGSTI